MFYSTKTFGHDLGLSACFRQWRANSHCNKLHGYALSFKFEFIAHMGLDARNWVMDFGALGPVRDWLKLTFDHKTLVAKDDPELDTICSLAGLGVADVLVVQNVGCEAFAHMAFEWVQKWLDLHGPAGVELRLVEVREHGANSAIYKNPNLT